MWSTHDYSLLTATSLNHSVHQAAWDPLTAYELTTVGAGIRFWLLEEDRRAKTCALKVLLDPVCMCWELLLCQVHEPELPVSLREACPDNVQFTSLSYGPDSLLYIATDSGELIGSLYIY